MIRQDHCTHECTALMTTSQEQIIQNPSIGQGQSTLRDLIPTCKQAALNKISGFAKGAHEFGREK